MAATGLYPDPVTPSAEGVTLAVRLTPRARREEIGRVVADAAGRAALRVAVTAPPEDGKANAALIALLAKRWKIPKRDFTLLTGAANRNKTLAIAGEPKVLAARLRGLIGAADG